MGFIDDKRSVSELPIKPRRTKGTYAYRGRNHFASAVILGGSLLGIAWMCLPNTNKIRDSLKRNFLLSEHSQQRAIPPFAGGMTSQQVDDLMKELGRDVDNGMN